MKKGKDLKTGDLVPIYYESGMVVSGPTWVDKVGVIVEVCGYKTSVLIDGKLESWDLSDLKKMAARERRVSAYGRQDNQ